MVNINKGFLIERMKEKSWGELFKAVKKIKSPKELTGVLKTWLSPPEIFLLEKRIAISLLLKEGVRHNEIKRRLDVSSQSISFVKRGLTRPPKKEKELKPITKKDLKKRKSRIPPMVGKGRWRFLDVTY